MTSPESERDRAQRAIGECMHALMSLADAFTELAGAAGEVLPLDPYERGVAVGKSGQAAVASEAVAHVLNRLMWLASEGQDEVRQPWQEALDRFDVAIQLPVGLPHTAAAISALLRTVGGHDEIVKALAPWVAVEEEAFWCRRIAKSRLTGADTHRAP